MPAQKWVDLSEDGYGVSILNDCKYGHSIQDNVIKLTLLRSPSYPDPSADEGVHQFIYSMLTHASNWKPGTIQAAYELNHPHITHYSPNQSEANINKQDIQESFIRLSQPNVILETIKRAEDGNGIIVRLFASQRRRCKFDLLTGFEMAQAWRVNILEEWKEELQISNNTLTYDISPYQILTFRLIPS